MKTTTSIQLASSLAQLQVLHPGNMKHVQSQARDRPCYVNLSPFRHFISGVGRFTHFLRHVMLLK